MANEVILSGGSAVARAEPVAGLLAAIRPEWQAKNLIARVKALIEVDPSSACQRILNAAIHDLKEKIVIAGIDIAAEATRQNRLPPIGKSEDLENYSAHNVINLSYRMGLLNRAEWRRISRCYEIRRDLEHEDDTYEAGAEDVFYIFKTAVEVVLSRDPVTLVRVADFKDLIEQPNPGLPSAALLEDFSQAPQPRQEEIGNFLISVAVDKSQPDLVQQNAVNAMKAVEPLFQTQAKLAIGTAFQARVGRHMTERQARVAAAIGVMPYVRQAARTEFFQAMLQEFHRVGTDWSSYDQHGDLLSGFEEVGGLDSCPTELVQPFLRWLTLTYIGTSGGRTSYGNIRNVFYSNSAAPIIKRVLESTSIDLTAHLERLRSDKDVVRRLEDKHIARRFESVVDFLERD